MRHAMLVISLAGKALFIGLAQAHQQCRYCVPLEDLLSETYAIQFLEDRVSSAIAFHNGSAQRVDSVLASQEYQDLMRPLLEQQLGLEPREVQLSCPRSPRPKIYYPSATPDDGYFYQLTAAISDWIRDYKERSRRKSEPEPEPTPLHPTAQMFQRQMLKLAPFAEMTPEKRAKASIGIQLPAWMPHLDESCHIIAAAGRTFGLVVALETPPSAAFTATGYELCRISYDAFECTGPGRLMTLEYNNDRAVASLMQTPFLGWAYNPTLFSARQGANSDELAKWIDDFISTEEPDKMMLTGTNSNDPVFTEALSKSRAGEYLEAHPSVPAADLLILGTAQEAKESIERQGDDCGEPERCRKIRIQADAIAGPRKWSHRPPIWARVRFDHEEL